MRFQKKAVHFLESLGYFCLESKGSHTPIDIVAIPTTKCKRSDVLYIQVKSGLNKPYPCQLKELIDMPLKTIAGLKLVMWFSQQKKKAHSKMILFAFTGNQLFELDFHVIFESSL